MQQTNIQITNLSKVFQRRQSGFIDESEFDINSLKESDKIALNQVNLQIQPGEVLGIIGRNGAGKSTLLSIIAGIAKQSHGTVVVNGKVTTIMTLGVGLREDLTGRDNIYLDGELQGKSRVEIDAVIKSIIDFAELGEFIDRPVKTYSTGMKSRLAFSMLVEIEPEILIIDEALSAGDVFFANKATKKIREICQKGKIVILVSHAMATINSMCTRCLWMEKGKIIMDDLPEVVTAKYLKKIKNEDEKELTLKNKEQSIVDQSGLCFIKNVALKKINSDYEQNVFYTSDGFSLEVEIDAKPSVKANLLITIERIDGLIIQNETYDLGSDFTGNAQVTLRCLLTIDALVLNKGFYEVKLEIFENDVRTNYFVRFFEIKNDLLNLGGAPLLHYPVEISQKNEGKSECSDLIELIAE